MRIKNSGKRVAAIILSAALVATSVNYVPVTVNAALTEEEKTSMETLIKSNKNLVYGFGKERIKAFPSLGEGNFEQLTDGNVNEDVNRAATAFREENTGFVFDLGAVYNAKDINQIISKFRNAENERTYPDGGYDVYFSVNGILYNEPVLRVSGDTVVSNVTDKDGYDSENVTVDNGYVRYIKFVYPKALVYGTQVHEIAIITNSDNPEKVEEQNVEEVKNLEVTSPEANQISVEFEGNGDANAVYCIYIDGELVSSTATAGAKNVFSNQSAVKHEVTVKAINAEGFISSGVSKEINVGGELTDEDMVSLKGYNLALGTSISHGEWAEGSEIQVTDGDISKWNNYGAVKTPGYFQINLDKLYDAKTIEKVVTWYRNGDGNLYPEKSGYEIQYSKNGTNFTTVKKVTAEEMPTGGDTAQNDSARPFKVADDVTDAWKIVPAVQYIRIVYNSSVTWGAQAREIAVFDTNGDAKEYVDSSIKEPAEVTAVADGYNKIKLNITGAENTDGYKYAVFLNGNKTLEGVDAGEHVITDVARGTYTVLVKSVVNEDYSEGVTVSGVIVEDPFEYTQSKKENAFADTDTYGNNYVRFSNVSASASSENQDAGKAIDGDIGTRWESEQGKDPQEIIVDLGAVYSVKDVAMVWEGAQAKDFTVEVSTDGSAYETVATIKNAVSIAHRYDDIVLKEEKNARYVKIHGTQRNLTFGYSIWEIAIYGPDEEKAPTATEGLQVQGYQMNTDTEGVAKNSPSFRVVSKVADKIQNNDGKAKTVKKYGTVYALADNFTDANTLVKDTDKAYSHEATDAGKFKIDGDDTQYYALTFTNNGKGAKAVQTNYIVRAYAELEDGTIVYSNPETVSIYNIAKTLYDDNHMATEAAHNYLYYNVLNLVAIADARVSILSAIKTELNITSTEDGSYATWDAVNKGMTAYMNAYPRTEENLSFAGEYGEAVKTIIENKYYTKVEFGSSNTVVK